MSSRTTLACVSMCAQWWQVREQPGEVVPRSGTQGTCSPLLKLIQVKAPSFKVLAQLLGYGAAIRV